MKSVLKIIPFLFLTGCTLLEDPETGITTDQIVGIWQVVEKEFSGTVIPVESVRYILDISEVEIVEYNDDNEKFIPGESLPQHHKYTLVNNELSFDGRSFALSFSSDTLIMEETTQGPATLVKSIYKYLPYTAGDLPPSHWPTPTDAR